MNLEKAENQEKVFSNSVQKNVNNIILYYLTLFIIILSDKAILLIGFLSFLGQRNQLKPH